MIRPDSRPAEPHRAGGGRSVTIRTRLRRPYNSGILRAKLSKLRGTSLSTRDATNDGLDYSGQGLTESTAIILEAEPRSPALRTATCNDD